MASVPCETSERNCGSETIGGGHQMFSRVITGITMEPVKENNSSSGQMVRNRRSSLGCKLRINGLSLIESVTKPDGLKVRGEGSSDNITVMYRRLEVSEIVYGLNVPGGRKSPTAAACA